MPSHIYQMLVMLFSTSRIPLAHMIWWIPVLYQVNWSSNWQFTAKLVMGWKWKRNLKTITAQHGQVWAPVDSSARRPIRWYLGPAVVNSEAYKGINQYGKNRNRNRTLNNSMTSQTITRRTCTSRSHKTEAHSAFR